MLKKLSLLLLLSPALIFNPIKATPSNTVNIKDCRVAFSTPSGLEYVELDGEPQQGSTICNIAFNIKNRQTSHSTNGMIDGWREMTDIALAVKSTPLDDAIKSVEKMAQNPIQSKIFKLSSKNETDLKNGKLYVYTYTASNPTPSMLRLRQTGKVIFILGDNTHSISYTSYLTNPPTRGKASLKTLNLLFTSFDFKSH
jgi:hypothetical protein